MHIEPTSRCTLACPACPRTWSAQQTGAPFPKQDLDLDDLWNFLNCDSGRAVPYLLLCGNHGDPIYYPRLLDLIDRFRSTKNFRIVTNGSFQSTEFWHKLGDRLTANDRVVFSIDGLEDTNPIYRINSDWQSIQTAVDIMVTKSAAVAWKTLIFSHNQDQIDQIRAVAESKGCEFQVQKSSRFGDEKLQPSEQFVDTAGLYRTYQNIELEPRCMTEHYISADGYYWPCCMITSQFTLPASELWSQRQQWRIAGRTMDELQSQLLTWRQTVLDHPNQAHDVCKMNCKPGQTRPGPG